MNESSPFLVPLIGLALSFAATRGLSSFLFGVATRVDPLVALRND